MGCVPFLPYLSAYANIRTNTESFRISYDKKCDHITPITYYMMERVLWVNR